MTYTVRTNKTTNRMFQIKIILGVNLLTRYGRYNIMSAKSIVISATPETTAT